MRSPQADKVFGNLILRHFNLGEIVHAKTNKVKAWDRRRDLVVRDLRILGAGGQEAIFWAVEQLVAAHFDVLTTYDEDIEARESADRETRYGHAFDWLLHSVDAFVLIDKVGDVKSTASYTYACLARSEVGGWTDWTCKIGAFVLDRRFLWSQGHSVADEGDAVCLDQELFGVSAGVDDDAAATGCGVDRGLDRLASSDTNCLIASSPSYRYWSARRCHHGVVT